MDPWELEYFKSKYQNVQDKIAQLGDRIKVYTFDNILKSGEENHVEAPELSPDTIFTLSYTSGTTGKPKGAMISHKNVISAITNEGCIVRKEEIQLVTLCYLPQAHVMSRFEVYRVAWCEGQVGVYSGDIMKVGEDCAILKPTGFNSVPRFYNKIHDAIRGQFSKQKGWKKMLIDWGIQTKLANLHRDGTVTHWFYDAVVFNKVKDVLGGNVQKMVGGSAPMNPDILEFQKICFSAPFCEGYGQTEALGMQFCGEFEDQEVCGHIGGIFDHIEFKLLDVPEMNYFSNNVAEDGKPNPKGEILVRGNSVIVGYYKNREQFDQAVDKDGWLHSGDIGEIGPMGRLKIIDRAKNIFKLSQGEYIAPDRLGEIYKCARSVSEIFVHGDSLKSTIVAMIFPDEIGLRELAKNNGVNEEEEFEKLCQDDKIKALVILELKQVAVTNCLKGFENIRGVYLCHQNFYDQGLLTEAQKVKRIEAKAFFKSHIDQLYKKLE